MTIVRFSSSTVLNYCWW